MDTIVVIVKCGFMKKVSACGSLYSLKSTTSISFAEICHIVACLVTESCSLYMAPTLTINSSLLQSYDVTLQCFTF